MIGRGPAPNPAAMIQAMKNSRAALEERVLQFMGRVEEVEEGDEVVERRNGREAEGVEQVQVVKRMRRRRIS